MRISPFFIYIVIAIVTTLFNRYKKSQEQAQRQSQRRDHLPGMDPMPGRLEPKTTQPAQPKPLQPRPIRPEEGRASTRLEPSRANDRPRENQPIPMRPRVGDREIARPHTTTQRPMPVPGSRSNQYDPYLEEMVTISEPVEQVSRTQVTTTPGVIQGTLERKKAGNDTSGQIRQGVSSSSQEKEQLKLKMTRENVVQGIILAEILQPPRARRPYRPTYLDREK